ncbi:replication protein RepO [Aggregatibacter kilianii]|uniref:replication protein RepO n=1 Tax=Aggregatibacter kilianii TaxID=2025884 RepID=UPI000D642E13|nr:replication protein RepO [Aggregatibacter kilianii]
MSKLLINEQPLQVIPSLAKAIGLNEAIFLQQLHYFLRISKNRADGRSWVYNTIKDWQAEFSFWSLKTVQRTIENLEKMGLILSTDKFNKMKMDKTKWYSIDYEKLSEISGGNTNPPFSQNDQMEYSESENAFSQNDQMSFSQNDQSNNQRDPKTSNNNPLPLNGESASAEGETSHLGENKKISKAPSINYSEIAQAYNDCVSSAGANLPLVADPSNLSDKRKRAVKKLSAVMLKRFGDGSVDAFRDYFSDFIATANPFYFGDNNRNWRADFEYLLRVETLDKTLERAL